MNRGRWQEFFADEQGNVIAGASVSVFNQATGLPAIVYHEVAGGAAKQTPFETDSRGFATFCAQSGRYRIVVAASGVETVINDVYIFPAEDREVGEAAFLNVGTTAGTVAAGDDPRFGGGGGGPVSWGSILGDLEDQTDLTSALDSKVDDSDPRLTNARPPTAHTHPISDVIGLQGELDDKEFTLTAGANITIDRTNPAAPVISSSGGGGGGGADWGQIGGDLSDQTDLMAALNGKANLVGGNTFTGLQSFERIRETVTTVTGTDPALGAGDGTIFTWTLSANSTPASGLADGESCTVLITPGAFSINWTNFNLSEAGAPELSSGKVTTVVLWCVGAQTFVDFVRQHDA